MVNIAHGTRDEKGRWHADDPTQYPPMDTHGQLPWSILDTTTNHWRQRQKWWRDKGVDDITDRLHAPAMINTGRHGKTSRGVSRFDPFLAELIITWWSAPEWHVYDPFAGGPVRGIVTEYLNRKYTGVDLNHNQIDTNHQIATAWHVSPHWIVGDGTEPILDNETQDLVFTCPPYHNKEKYSDDPSDLSHMRWEEFLNAHEAAVINAAATLKQNRHMVWVISDVRDHKGHLRGLPEAATQHIKAAGLHITNQLILMESGGTRVKTMRIPWQAARTTTRRHQHIIIAVKGDRKEAVKDMRDANRLAQAYPA